MCGVGVSVDVGVCLNYTRSAPSTSRLTGRALLSLPWHCQRNTARSMAANTPPLPRYCLVTVGATTGFEALTREVLDPDFWYFLRSDGFTALHVQCGPDVAWAAEAASEAQHRLPKGFSVDVFDVKKNLKEEMLLCRARPGLRAQGVVISHAGMSDLHLRPALSIFFFFWRGKAAQNGLSCLQARARYSTHGVWGSRSWWCQTRACSMTTRVRWLGTWPSRAMRLWLLRGELASFWEFCPCLRPELPCCGGSI